MRKAAGIILLIVGFLPMLLLPFLIVWGILECGPVNSSCHHFPYRMVAFGAVTCGIICVGLWLVIQPRRRS